MGRRDTVCVRISAERMLALRALSGATGITMSDLIESGVTMMLDRLWERVAAPVVAPADALAEIVGNPGITSPAARAIARRALAGQEERPAFPWASPELLPPGPRITDEERKSL